MRTVKILGKTWTVDVMPRGVDPERTGRCPPWGRTLFDGALIQVSGEIDQQHQDETFLHEILHVIDFELGGGMEEQQIVPVWDVIRMIATTRIVMPNTTVRLSAGRTEMSTEAQALCFMAGASSIFAGEKLLTTPNPGEDKDAEMFSLLGLTPTEKKKDDTGKFKIRRSLVEAEEEKWSRPGHRIERNVEAAEKAREIRRVQRQG